MTLREYVENHIEEVVAELCQYQHCDNCSIGCLYGSNDCGLYGNTIDEALDTEIEVEE